MRGLRGASPAAAAGAADALPSDVESFADAASFACAGSGACEASTAAPDMSSASAAEVAAGAPWSASRTASMGPPDGSSAVASATINSSICAAASASDAGGVATSLGAGRGDSVGSTGSAARPVMAASSSAGASGVSAAADDAADATAVSAAFSISDDRAAVSEWMCCAASVLSRTPKLSDASARAAAFAGTSLDCRAASSFVAAGLLRSGRAPRNFTGTAEGGPSRASALRTSSSRNWSARHRCQPSSSPAVASAAWARCSSECSIHRACSFNAARSATAAPALALT